MGQDVEFKDYMRLQYTFYIDGKANFKVEELMEVAASKYKMLVKNGSWKTTESTDNPFVALTAEAEFDCKPVQVNANINRVGGQFNSPTKVQSHGPSKIMKEDRIPFSSRTPNMPQMRPAGYCHHNIGAKTPQTMQTRKACVG